MSPCQPQARAALQAAAAEGGVPRIASIPVTTAEVPGAWTPGLVAAVDAIFPVLLPALANEHHDTSAHE